MENKMGFLKGYMEGIAMRKNPKLLQQYIDNQEYQRGQRDRQAFMSQLETDVEGKEAVAGVYNNQNAPNTKYGGMDLNVQKLPNADEVRDKISNLAMEAPGANPLDPTHPSRMVSPAQAAIQGLTDRQLALRLLQAPTAGNRQTGGSLLQTLLKPQGQSNFSFQQYQAMSPQERQVFDRYKGRGFSTGNSQGTANMQDWKFRQGLSPQQQQQWDNQRKVGNRYYNAGNAYVNPQTGQNIPINLGPEQQPQYLYEKSRQGSQATADVTAGTEAEELRGQAKVAKQFTGKIKDLSSTMDPAQFGWLPNQLPNLTGSAQLMQSYLNNLIPGVIQMLGPNNKLTDGDIAVMQRSLPHMGMEKAAFDRALVEFEATRDAILARGGAPSANGRPAGPENFNQNQPSNAGLSASEQSRLDELRQKYGR